MIRPGSILSRGLALVLMLGAVLTFYDFALLPLLAAHSWARAISSSRVLESMVRLAPHRCLSCPTRRAGPQRPISGSHGSLSVRLTTCESAAGHHAGLSAACAG